MKSLRLLITVLLFATRLRAQSALPVAVPPTDVAAHRPRIALALSGGGSLGLAHIGVLKYFEEHHIPVDAIAGTSIGGIVGGLYATGHTPAEIEASFSQAAWNEVLRAQPAYRELPMQAREDRANHPGDFTLRLGRGLSLPAGISVAEPLDLFLSRQVLAYSAVEDFGQLPTPFRCVATQLETGQPFVLRHGNLARAMRASMSVPGIFTPVEWEGHILVDGGLVDNLPTDVAREMGDVVIAVHFSTPVPPARQLQSMTNVLTQAVSVAVSVTERENLRNADLVLAPSLVGIGGTDYAHAHELVERGYQAAAQKQRFLATLALNDTDWAAYLAERSKRMRPPAPQNARLVAQSSDRQLASYAQAELDHARGPFSTSQFEQELSSLVASSALPGAFYRLGPAQVSPLNAETSTTQNPTIVAEVEPRPGSQIFIRPALDLAVANGEPTRGTLRGFVAILPKDAYRARYRLQFSVGYSPMFSAEYEHPIHASQWYWSPSLNLQRENSATYVGDAHLTHWQDSYSTAVDLGYGVGARWRVRGGVETGYEALSDRQLLGARPEGDGAYVAPRLIAEWNSLDDPSLPTRGVLFTSRIAAKSRAWDTRTVPLGQAYFAQYRPLRGGVVTVSANAASSFGVPLNYFDLFPLGGPSDLRAFRFQQFHATSYALGGVAYRKPVRDWKLLGQSAQFGAWYEAAGLTQPVNLKWQSAQSGSLGVLFNSPLGVVTFAIGRTSDHQTRAWINVGRP